MPASVGRGWPWHGWRPLSGCVLALLLLCATLATAQAAATELAERESFVGAAKSLIQATGEKHDIDDILPVMGMALAEKLPIGNNLLSGENIQPVWPVYGVQQLRFGPILLNLVNVEGQSDSALWLTRHGRLQYWQVMKEQIPYNGLTLIGRGKTRLALVELTSTATYAFRLLIFNWHGKRVEYLATGSKLDEIRFFPGSRQCLLTIQTSGITAPVRLVQQGTDEARPRSLCLNTNGRLTEIAGTK